MRNTLSRLTTFCGALLLIGCAATATRADTVNIVGVDTGAASTATINCSFNAQTNTFTFTITNTSPSASTITAIGLDLPPIGNASPSGLNGFTGNVVFQPVGTNFTFADGELGNVPHGFNSAVIDVAFITGSNFAGGNVNEGLPPGIAPGAEATFVISGAAFAGFTEEQICAAFFVRFQNVPVGAGSDVGRPTTTPTNPVPEPATMILLGTGLAGVAAKVRRRRKGAAAAE